MRYTVLRAFRYSTDGINQFHARPGREPDPPIPADLIAGLAKEGYLGEAKAIGDAPENKAIAAAPANKRDVAKGPRGLWYVVENGVRVSSGFPTEDEAIGAL